jgi:hypothetical protein
MCRASREEGRRDDGRATKGPEGEEARAGKSRSRIRRARFGKRLLPRRLISRCTAKLSFEGSGDSARRGPLVFNGINVKQWKLLGQYLVDVRQIVSRET